MELESEDGSKIPIQSNSNIQIGRELALRFCPSSTDRTVSRRHLSLRLTEDPVDKFRIQFEVIGKNPVWVCSKFDGGGRIYKNLEKGELRVGDKFSLSIKKPSFFVVRRRQAENEAVESRVKGERTKGEVFEGEEDEIGYVDVSHIDPVKEFGFLLKGHEFDRYPKKKILDIRSWNWFLEEMSCSTDDDETGDGSTSSQGRRKGRRTKKKKGGDNDDEDWTGESEEEQVAAVKGQSNKCTKYSTRSKGRKRPRNDASGASKKGAKVLKDKSEDEDEKDETLGGFIVDDDEEEEEEDDEESEEEFEVDEEDVE